MKIPRFAIVVWHGENQSKYHVVDTWAPDEFQPAVIQTCRSFMDAERFVALALDMLRRLAAHRNN